MSFSHVGFISNASGERFALPEAARADNEWKVPVSVFEVRYISGQMLVKLNPTPSGQGFEIASGPDGQPVLSAKVQCAMSQTDEIRTYGPLGPLADADGLVRVLFGESALTE